MTPTPNELDQILAKLDLYTCHALRREILLQFAESVAIKQRSWCAQHFENVGDDILKTNLVTWIR